MNLALQSLVYPLNIYAALMHRVCGDVSHLCYGLSKPGCPVQVAGSLDDAGSLYQAGALCKADRDNMAAALSAAQQRMVDTVIAAMRPPAPARVLDLGCGLGSLAWQLQALGYQVTGVEPQQSLLDAARSQIIEGTESPQWLQATVTELAQQLDGDSSERFDVIILLNSARYEQPLTVLGTCTQLLAPGGQLLIAEEFDATTPRHHQPAELPVLANVLALAGRSGLQLESDQDLSVATADFVAALAQLLHGSAEAVAEVTGTDIGAIQVLLGTLQRDLERLRCGDQSHRLLSWRLPAQPDPQIPASHARNQAPAVHVWPASLLAAERFQALFEQSFDVTFDAALWHWKYGDMRSTSVVAVRDGEPVAHYGGIRRSIDYFGAVEQAVQVCDVMVKPQERSFFSRHGLFFKTAAAMLEQHTGYHARQLLGFGFPNLKAMHVAARLGLYATTDELLSVRAAPHLSVSAGWQAELQPLADVPFNLLARWWDEMRQSFGDAILGHRDPAWLQYRYVQRPGLDYQTMVILCDGTPVGLAVLRDEGGHDLLMDLICASTHLADAFRAVVAARRAAGRELRYWVTAGQMYRLQSEDPMDLIIEHMDVYVPCNVWVPGPGTGELQGAWWLTAGDTDFL